jgi:hypothetical protein
MKLTIAMLVSLALYLALGQGSFAQEVSPRNTVLPADSASPASAQLPASRFQGFGAGCFGTLIGWYLYFTNRHRTGAIKPEDIVTVVGVLGGAAIMKLFPAGSDLFAAYGIGLAAGFFGYFLVLLVLVWRSDKFDLNWFLDGKRIDGTPTHDIPMLTQRDLRPK